jgi:hypothetical protein
MNTSAEELARIRQRQFYLDMSERFTKMAEEYEPIHYRENPLPIHGYTAVVVLHSSEPRALSNEVQLLSNGWDYSISEFGKAESRSRDMHGGRVSVRMEHIYPEQNEERYRRDLEAWSAERKAKRGAKS